MQESSLALYWELASIDPAVRIKSAEALMKTLLQFQAGHSSNLQEISSVAELDVACAPDVAYGLKRLLRGLPSSREGARQGFSMALSEVPQLCIEWIQYSLKYL